MKAALLISHGSRSAKTKKEVETLVEKLKSLSGFKIFEYAFLEIEEPDIPKGIDLCAKKGAREIMVLLNFLNSGRHVDCDIPRIVAEARERYPSIHFSISKPVGQHPRIPELFKDLLNL